MLSVQGLRYSFPTAQGRVQAVRGVDFEVGRGETLALVGESGSGKSTTARAVARLIDGAEGAVFFDGVDVLSMSRRSVHRLRSDIQMVFQDPYSSLDPRRSLRHAIREPLDVHRVGTRRSRDGRVEDLVERVGLSSVNLDSRPDKLSGGQRQRVAIARALALKPRLVICDEAVSALDVSIQAQVLNLLSDLQADLGVSFLFITHDLAVVSEIASRVAVMYLGRIVEMGECDEVLRAPQHPYTRLLLSAAPRLAPSVSVAYPAGEPASPLSPPAGCSFRTRCPRAAPVCADVDPALEARDETSTRPVACHFPVVDNEELEMAD
jgi:oligopeptide/dipeptide ABC transporter ATP-binding protein